MTVEINTLSDYIGQTNIKQRVQISATASLIQKRSFPHTLMSGPPGLGKTTLARIIAKEVGCPFFSYIGAGLDEKSIEAILSNLPKNGYNKKTGKVMNRNNLFPSIIFIDEIHNLSKKITEMLHTVLEDRTITLKRKNHENGRVEPCLCWVPEFTLIGATNYLGSLPKPFRDRFQNNIIFEIYSEEEMLELIAFNSRKMLIPVEEQAMICIASKSRGVPRIALSYFKKAHDVSVIRCSTQGIENEIIMEDVQLMLESEEVDDLGLTRIDRKALTYLLSVNRPIGIKAFAQAVDEDVQTLETVIEPWLVKLNFIVRTGSGRYLTEKGRKYIGKEREFGLLPILEDKQESCEEQQSV